MKGTQITGAVLVVVSFQAENGLESPFEADDDFPSHDWLATQVTLAINRIEVEVDAFTGAVSH